MIFVVSLLLVKLNRSSLNVFNHLLSVKHNLFSSLNLVDMVKVQASLTWQMLIPGQLIITKLYVSGHWNMHH